MSQTSNIVFMGSPAFAVSILEAILASGRQVLLVVTQPDKPAGRGGKLRAPAVKEFAVQQKLSLVQPAKMKDPALHEQLRKTGAEIFVVAAYGRILPRLILDIPKFTLNVHASLLPKWRGAAPIERAILNGDDVTGVSIMQLVEEMDAGDVMLTKEIKIGGDETAGELEERLSVLGAKALVEALDLIDRGEAQFKPQNPTKVTLCPPLESIEGKIDWNQTARKIHNQVRGLQPWPGAFTLVGSERIKIYKTALSQSSVSKKSAGELVREAHRLFVACGDAWIEILELQREGKKRQPASQFLSGYRSEQFPRWG